MGIAQRRRQAAVLERFLRRRQRAGGADDARSAGVAQIVDPEIIDPRRPQRRDEGLAQRGGGQRVSRSPGSLCE